MIAMSTEARFPIKGKTQKRRYFVQTEYLFMSKHFNCYLSEQIYFADY